MGSFFSAIYSFIGFTTPRPQQNTTLMALPDSIQEYIIEVLVSSDISGACALASTCRHLRNSLRVFVRLPGTNMRPDQILSTRSLLCGRKIGMPFSHFPIIAIGEIQYLDMHRREMFLLNESNGFADAIQRISTVFREYRPASPRNIVCLASSSLHNDVVGLYMRMSMTCAMGHFKVGDKVRIFGTFREYIETNRGAGFEDLRIIEYFASIVRVLV